MRCINIIKKSGIWTFNMEWVLILISITLVSSPFAQADFLFRAFEDPFPTQPQVDGILNIEPRVSIYSTNTNLDDDGESITPLGLDSYGRFQIDSDIRYGLINDFILFARLSWTRVSVTFQNSGSALSTISKFAFGDQKIGAAYRVWKTRTGNRFDLMLKGSIPLYDNEKTVSAGEPILGDGTSDITTGGFFQFSVSRGKTSRFYITGGTGLTYRSDDFSMAIPWSAFASLEKFSKGLEFKGGISGQLSLNSDDTLARLNTNLQGSFASNAVNPTAIQIYADIGYRFNIKTRVSANFMYPLFGRSIAQGAVIGVALSLNFGDLEGRDPNPGRIAPGEYGKSNAGFVTYTGQATVIRINDRFNLLKINKGSNNGVKKGQIFDIFEVGPTGEIRRAVARAVVTDVKENESALKVKEYFREVWIDKGFVAKAVLEQ